MLNVEEEMNRILWLTLLFLLIAGSAAAMAAGEPPKQINSIEDGFRGIPWGSDTEYLKSKGYICSVSQASGKTACQKPGDRMSLGNMDLKSIVCDLANSKFEAVIMTFDASEAETALMSLKSSFGEWAKAKKIGKMIKIVWVKGTVTITLTNSTIEIRKYAKPVEVITPVNPAPPAPK
jgi:hypothetical protein